MTIQYRFLWSKSIVSLLCLGILFLSLGVTSANELPAELLPSPEANTVVADFVPWCPSQGALCRVDRQWTISELQAQLGESNWAIWQEGDQLIFAFYGQADEVSVTGGIATPLIPVNNSPYWVATLRVDNLDRAIITHLFAVRQSNELQYIRETYGEWRGNDAPPPPERATPLKGRIKAFYLYSPSMDAMRLVNVYLPYNYDRRQTYPVIYMTRGHNIEFFARVLEPLIKNGSVPPVLLIGVFPSQDAMQTRQEYMLGFDDETYLEHEHFFTETVRRWAELGWGASEDPQDRAIMGFSDGAIFASNTGIRKPDTYGQVISLSAFRMPNLSPRSRLDASYFISSGTLDNFYDESVKTYFTLRLLGADAQFSARVAGHDGLLWQEEFVAALRWMFSEN